MWGGSHQLEACPNLPVAKKVEVLVERFDASGVSFANKPVSSSLVGMTKPLGSWVTITPKKRMRAPRKPKAVFSPPGGSTSVGPCEGTPVVALIPPLPTPFPAVPILSEGMGHPQHAGVPISVAKVGVHGVPLVEPTGELLHNMDDDTNVDMFLNLHNLVGIETSTDSAKRKRCEDGEEVTS